jgi:hypothetical protein
VKAIKNYFIEVSTFELLESCRTWRMSKMEMISEMGKHQHNKTAFTALPDEFKGGDVR